MKPIPTDPGGVPLPLAAPAWDMPRRARFAWGKLIAVLAALLLLPFFFLSSEGERGLLAICFAALLFFLLKRAPAAGVAATLAYLMLVGGLRRWLIPVFDWSPTDPLLLVAPTAAVAYLAMTRQTTGKTLLSRLLIVLMVLMAIEIVNPIQGGLAVGMAGALFYICPLLWFFIGRQVATPALVRSLVRAAAVFAFAGALYGLYQTYFGFNAAELMWVRITKEAYAALGVGGRIRPFSFFTSAAEYAEFMGLGIVLLWALFLRGSRWWLLLVPVLGLALFFESVRSALVSTLAAGTLLWAVQGRSYRQWLPRVLAGLAAVVIIGVWGLNRVQSMNFSNQTEGLVQHQVGGLLNPLDQSQSTADAHTGMIANGIIEGFRNPVGTGLGSTTIAGAKFGGSGAGAGTEADFSNMFVSLGFIGGLLYLVIMGIVLSSALRLWQRRRSTEALAILGILVMLIGYWLNGGHYAGSMLAWLCVGFMDRFNAQDRSRGRERTVPQNQPGITTEGSAGTPQELASTGGRGRLVL